MQQPRIGFGNTLALFTLVLTLTFSNSANSANAEDAKNAKNAEALTKPIEVKIVVAAMFEDGELTGDDPGEMQLWVERLKLDQDFPFPLGEYELRMNKEGVLGIVLGGGIANATASVMALGMDARFDLSNAYWLIAGIAGADPTDMSLGSAAWARWVVDGDLLYEIDGREIPDSWQYGFVPLGGRQPADKPEDIYTEWTVDTLAFELNQSLTYWAFELTKDVPILDGHEIKTFRQQFAGYPMATRPPFVTMGETLSASTYWHGELMNKWANDWIKLYTHQEDRKTEMNFMTSNMEDSGTLTALHRLGRTKLVNTERVLVLRTASNYTMPPPGKDAAWSTTAPYPDGGLPAIESAFTIGNVVVQELLKNWDKYEIETP
jgi:purine nucleoside permease